MKLTYVLVALLTLGATPAGLAGPDAEIGDRSVRIGRCEVHLDDVEIHAERSSTSLCLGQVSIPRPVFFTEVPLPETPCATLEPCERNVRLASLYKNHDQKGDELYLYTRVFGSESHCERGYIYPTPALPAGWNDVISSARVHDEGCKVVLYEHAGMEGRDLPACMPGGVCEYEGVYNDIASSMRLYGGY